MAMKIQISVLWVVTWNSGVVGYQRFGGLCCLHLQGEVDLDVGLGSFTPKMKAGRSPGNVGILPQHCTASQLGRPRLLILANIYSCVVGCWRLFTCALLPVNTYSSIQKYTPNLTMLSHPVQVHEMVKQQRLFDYRSPVCLKL
jgi:hypothetical protein